MNLAVSADPASFRAVVVGSGFYGAVMAERIATQLALPVLVLERRSHIGGNSWSEIDPQTGIEVHRYGSHIFHTSKPDVLDWLAGLGEAGRINHYRHRVLAEAGGRVYPLPVNLATLESFFGRRLPPREARELLARETAGHALPPGAKPASFEQAALAAVGPRLYHAFFRGYTRKQWGRDPRELPASTFARLPVRFSYLTDYFDDPAQGIPIHGYGALFRRALDHPLVEVRTGVDFLDMGEVLDKNALVIFTGPIDAYFRHGLGRLSWRTLDFEVDRPALGDFQGCAVLNRADEQLPFTRTHEFRHYHPERDLPTDTTVIYREYPREAGPTCEPYYPVNSPSDAKLLAAYKSLASGERNVIFGGRLGEYRYLNMDETIQAALDAFKTRVARKLRE